MHRDANGTEKFITYLAALCRNETLTPSALLHGNANQTTIFPPLQPSEVPDLCPEIWRPSTLGNPPSPWPPARSSGLWRIFRFTKSKIATLKRTASELCSKESGEYISSNDAVTAFIWSRVAAVRSAWLPVGSRTLMIRAVNGRRRFEPAISDAYAFSLLTIPKSPNSLHIPKPPSHHHPSPPRLTRK